ncbi:MAG: hypothetical protein FMNOHCHN_03908 [Ignavibacteriaceae bacterium]|nr:hypothetical protein [Ignavibacteriaceae bacterium]
MTNTPITDKTIRLHSFWGTNPIELDGEPVQKEMKKLETAANKLYSRLSIWVNSASANNYIDPKDVEALAEFELLNKGD